MMVATRIFTASGPAEGNLDHIADIVTFDAGQYVGLDAVLARYSELEEEIREMFYG